VWCVCTVGMHVSHLWEAPIHVPLLKPPPPPPGETFGLLGENGAGKTTLLSMVMGMTPPSGGRGYAAGFDVARQSDAVRRNLGVALQHDVTWPMLSVREHCTYYARVKGVPEQQLEAHVDGLLERVGLTAFAARRASALSGGMRRRLTLAMALAGDSPILICDEITTGLDPASKRRVWQILAGVRREGRVVMLVTHDMDEVEALSQRVGVMTFGRLRVLGTPAEIRERYGGGFSLSVDHDPGVDIVATIRNLFPAATLLSHFTGHATFLIPAGTTRMSALFAAMQAHGEAAGVTDWEVGPMSLDDVFRRLVRHYRAAPQQRGRSGSGSEDDVV